MYEEYFNKTINRLTIKEYVGFFYKSGNKRHYLKVECSCGIVKNVMADRVVSGKLISCGCAQVEASIKTLLKYRKPPKHGALIGARLGKGVKEYRIWSSMKCRCLNSNDNNYYKYGARGIKVCDRWLDEETGFQNFIEDMGLRPSIQHSIDRIDNNGNYEPENCRWATKSEQNYNRRMLMLTYDNLTLSINQWSDKLKIDKSLIRYRLKRGWDISDVLSSDKNIRKYVKTIRNLLQSI